MTQFRARLFNSKLKIAIIVSRFNEFITKRLLESALETLAQAGIPKNHIAVFWVPGALEIPFFCKKAAMAKKWDALIALACVIRGQTHHFECVSEEVTRGISQAALETGIPMATAVLTVDNLEQAIDRAGLKAGNKGADAALAALEIANLNKQLQLKRLH